MAIASKLIDKAVIINTTISETAITLLARVRCNSIPVGSWLLPRDTFPLNRMPGTEADNEIESATGAFLSSALGLTANSSVGCVCWGIFAGIFGVSGRTFRAGVVIRSRTVVSYLSNGYLFKSPLRGK